MGSDLKERAFQFSTLQLPGQPQMMHMGTARLVNDLSARIAELEICLALMILDCENLHHRDSDIHSMADPCPVVARIHAAKG